MPKPIFPRLMWADADPDDKRTPVVVYNSRADQRGNRPELKPIRVLVSLSENAEAKQLASIRGAVCEYRRALNAREHGGVALDKCIKAIEEILDLPF